MKLWLHMIHMKWFCPHNNFKASLLTVQTLAGHMVHIQKWRQEDQWMLANVHSELITCWCSYNVPYVYKLWFQGNFCPASALFCCIDGTAKTKGGWYLFKVHSYQMSLLALRQWLKRRRRGVVIVVMVFLENELSCEFSTLHHSISLEVWKEFH